MSEPIGGRLRGISSWRRHGISVWFGAPLFIYAIAGIILVLAGLACIFFLLKTTVARPVLTPFEVVADTTNLRYVVGNPGSNQGIFNGEAPLDLTVEAAKVSTVNCASRGEGGQAALAGGNFKAYGVYLQEVDLPEGTVVEVNVDPEGDGTLVKMKVLRPEASTKPMAIVGMDKHSAFDLIPSASGSGARATDGPLMVCAANQRQVTLSLRYRGKPPEPEGPVSLPDEPGKAEVTLGDLSHAGSSSIVGDDSKLLFERRRDPYPLSRTRVAVSGLERGTMQELAVVPQSAKMAAHLHVIFSGESKSIEVTSAFTGQFKNRADDWLDELQDPGANRSALALCAAVGTVVIFIGSVASLLGGIAQGITMLMELTKAREAAMKEATEKTL